MSRQPEHAEQVPEAATGVVKHSLVIAGHRTSVSLEAPFWDALRDIAEARHCSMAAVVASIDAGRKGQNLSSAIRVYVLAYVRQHGMPGT